MLTRRQVIDALKRGDRPGRKLLLRIVELLEEDKAAGNRDMLRAYLLGYARGKGEGKDTNTA